nr:MAG TPA: hypothetical protein [Caudoviricetes sp.]
MVTCNAYKLKLEIEYNVCKSSRQPKWLKRYAELIGNYKNYGIKSL